MYLRPARVGYLVDNSGSRGKSLARCYVKFSAVLSYSLILPLIPHHFSVLRRNPNIEIMISRCGNYEDSYRESISIFFIS